MAICDYEHLTFGKSMNIPKAPPKLVNESTAKLENVSCNDYIQIKANAKLFLSSTPEGLHH